MNLKPPRPSPFRRGPGAQPEALEQLYEKWQWVYRSDTAVWQRSAHNWRRAFFVLAFYCAAQVGLGFYRDYRFSRAEPVLVGYDARAGQAVYLGTAGDRLRDFSVPPNAITAQLTSFVEKTRRITSDPALTLIDREEVRGALSGHAALLIEQHFRQRDAGSRRGRTLVKVTSVLPVPASKDGWIVDWNERVVDSAGDDSAETAWRGTFTVNVVKMTALSEQQLRRNPLGIFVHDFQWKELPTSRR
jgi:type IV secretory pathway TrbF-like protein